MSMFTKSNMKKIFSLSLVLTIFSFSSVLCAEQTDSNNVGGVPIYDVVTLKPILEMQIGKLVGVRFNYRHQRIRHIKPNWYEGSIWQSNPQEKSGYSYLRVVVAKKDRPKFESIPADFTSRDKMVVYGRVSKDREANYVFIRLLGRKATIDSTGKTIIDW